jgi:hypothetical protein
MSEKLTGKMRECLVLVASEPQGVIGVYDERLDRFSDDNGRDDDTLNLCFSQKLLAQTYDGDSDNGTIHILPAGRLALKEAGHAE